MACNTCNSPTSSGGNLPAKKKAYLTDPVSAKPSCGCGPQANPCKPYKSVVKWLQNFIPGWLQKVTPAPSGKMLIARGDVLHKFEGYNPGPLYYDGDNVTVAAQPTLTTKAAPESVIERGHLTIAKKVSRAQVAPDGTPFIGEFYEHGVQAIGEEDEGLLPVLTIDNLSGEARFDALKPQEWDATKKGLPCNARRLVFAEEDRDGGCGTVKRHVFYGMRGAVFGDDEIPKDQAGGVPVVLVPVNKKCGDCEVVEWRLSIPENNQIPGVFGVPTGTVLPFAGDTLPADYLMCDGSEVSRTQYAALYAAIGTIYGGGDGVTTFNLPDLRGRAPFGRDDMGGTAASRVTNTGTGNPNIDGTTLGAVGGADRHQLTIPQMPEHTHDYRHAGGVGSAVNVDDGSINLAITPTSPTGGDEPHPQMPPAIILNYIIKY